MKTVLIILIAEWLKRRKIIFEKASRKASDPGNGTSQNSTDHHDATTGRSHRDKHNLQKKPGNK